MANIRMIQNSVKSLMMPSQELNLQDLDMLAPQQRKGQACQGGIYWNPRH